MKNKLLSTIIFAYCFLFVIACGADGTECPDITEYVGRNNSAIIITSDLGGKDTIAASDASGWVTHPCNTSIGSGEYGS